MNKKLLQYGGARKGSYSKPTFTIDLERTAFKKKL